MSAQATERRAARYEAQSALDGKAQWRFVTNECCVADVDHCLLVRTKVSTAQNPKGRPVVFAFHREARVLYAPRNDGYTSGEVFPVDLSHVPARLRAAVVCGLTMDKDAREWVQEHRNGKHQNEPAERAESEATMPPTAPKPVTLAVRKDEKRMTLVQRTFTVELSMALPRAHGRAGSHLEPVRGDGGVVKSWTKWALAKIAAGEGVPAGLCAGCGDCQPFDSMEFISGRHTKPDIYLCWRCNERRQPPLDPDARLGGRLRVLALSEARPEHGSARDEAVDLAERALSMLREGPNRDDSAAWRLVDALGLLAEHWNGDLAGFSDATGRGYRVVKQVPPGPWRSPPKRKKGHR